jgi:hypothetical protein
MALGISTLCKGGFLYKKNPTKRIEKIVGILKQVIVDFDEKASRDNQEPLDIENVALA